MIVLQIVVYGREYSRKNHKKLVLYLYICRTMDPDAEAEWNSLMEYDWSGTGNDAAAPPAAADPAADEHLLDADFEEDDEPVILTPVQAPTPPVVVGSSPQRSPEKVNENENSITLDSTDENYYPFSGGSDSEFTDMSNITSYSRYGIRFKAKTGETLPPSDPEKPTMSSEYHQCKAARAASLSFQTTAVTFDENIGKNETVKFSPLSSLN
jgi:hypothetical protein